MICPTWILKRKQILFWFVCSQEWLAIKALMKASHWDLRLVRFCIFAILYFCIFVFVYLCIFCVLCIYIFAYFGICILYLCICESNQLKLVVVHNVTQDYSPVLLICIYVFVYLFICVFLNLCICILLLYLWKHPTETGGRLACVRYVTWLYKTDKVNIPNTDSTAGGEKLKLGFVSFGGKPRHHHKLTIMVGICDDSNLSLGFWQKWVFAGYHRQYHGDGDGDDHHHQDQPSFHRKSFSVFLKTVGLCS